MIKEFYKDKLNVRIYETRKEMGESSAEDIAKTIKELLSVKNEISMIFAAAPSQNEVLEALCNNRSIDWSRINAFHMDEYVGLDKDAPQGFANFLKRAIFDKVPFKTVNLLDSENDPEAECKRYTELLNKQEIDIVVMGIGENGHIAFNDPHVAEFNDAKTVKTVELDEICRNQQVHDGCFASLDSVPKKALTLTVPTLAKCKYHFCIVPAKTKANAVYNTVEGEISEKCPASILRITDNSILYTDSDSGEKLL